MLRDQDMILDCQHVLKHQAVHLTRFAGEASSSRLRQTLLELRGRIEGLQEEAYHIAERHGWYLASPQADPEEVQKVRQHYEQQLQAARAAR